MTLRVTHCAQNEHFVQSLNIHEIEKIAKFDRFSAVENENMYVF